MALREKGAVSFIRDLSEIMISQDATIIANAAQLVSESARAKWLAAIMRVYSKQGVSLVIVNSLARSEVSLAASPSFTSGSATAKAIASLALAGSTDWLREILAGPVARIIESGVSIEVDPARLQKGQDLATCQAKLRDVLSEIFRTASENVERAPPRIREACAVVADITGAKFTDARYAIVRQAIFSNLIVGALANPEQIGLYSGTISPAGHRALYVVSKVAANVVQNKEFDARWDFLKPFEPFVAENQPLLAAYIESFSQHIPQFREVGEEYDPKGLSQLQTKLDYIDRGLAQLFLTAGAPDLPPVHICHDSSDEDMIAKTLDPLKDKIIERVGNAEGSCAVRLASLLKNWSTAKAKGTSVEAVMTATKEIGMGSRTLDPKDKALDAKAGELGASVLSIAKLAWLEADEMDHVAIAIMEGGIDGVPSDHITLKGSIRVNFPTDFVVKSLQNLAFRPKWDRLSEGGVTKIRDIGLHSRIIHIQCKSPKSDFLLLEHCSPAVAGMGGQIAFTSIDEEVTLPYDSGYPRGRLAYSGFIVNPVTDTDQSCRVTYMLNAKFAGVAVDDAWSPGMEIVCTLNKLQEALKALQ